MVIEALKSIGGILAVIAFVSVQAARVATAGKPVGPSYADQTTHRTQEAIGWPVWLVCGAAILGMVFL